MADVRRFGWVAVIAMVAMLTAVPPAAAQLIRDHEKEGGVRGFHGPRPLGGIKRSFQSDAEARAEFERIVAAVGLNWITDRITLRASAETPNAEAFIGKTGERFIFYNAAFMQKVKQRTAEHWSMVSILAHEIGHHLALHTEIEGRWHEFELEADCFSGFVLRRLGASLDQAQTAMRLIGTKEASQTHPTLDQRLQVITIGWTDAGSGGPPRGPKDIRQPPSGPQSGADAEALAKERERLARLQKQQEEERGAVAGTQPAVAKLRHGMSYAEARTILLAGGWQPVGHPWQTAAQRCWGRERLCEQYVETVRCSGTGHGVCLFEFVDASRRKLEITTQGESDRIEQLKLANWRVE